MWVEMSLEVDPRDAELVADVLAQRCPRVAVEYKGPFPFPPPWPAELPLGHRGEKALVHLYLPEEEYGPEVRRSLAIALQFVPLARRPRWRPMRRLREEGWQRAWRRHLRARRVGRVVVRPPWRTASAQAGEVVIDIDPGMAFGTGSHPTTALCLAALQQVVTPGVAVLDVGTGTGILAIAALKLGARRALALDIDPQAVRAALENARRNGVAEHMEVRLGTLTPEVVGEGPFPVVVANIDGLTIRRLAPLLAQALAPGGRLVVSGFLVDGAQELAAALEPLGLAVERSLAEGVWAALLLRKAP